VLGLSPLPRTLPAALRDVRDKKVLVRASAVRDLSRLAVGSERESAVRALAGVVAEDAAPGVRADACVALADAEAHEALAELVAAARDDEALRVRQMALLALGELATTEDADACAVIERGLEDPAPELRFQALIAVGRILGRGAHDAICRAVGDADAHVRYVAFRLAEEHWANESRSEAPEALLDAARSALEDDDPRVRLAAAILLAHAGDDSGRGMLVSAVNSSDGAFEPEDEQAAIDLSGRLGLTGARPGLQRRAFGTLGFARDPFSWQARVALARLGDARARQAILRGLSSWTRDARTMAVAAAGQARLAEARPVLEAMRGQADRAEPQAVEEALQLLDET